MPRGFSGLKKDVCLLLVRFYSGEDDFFFSFFLSPVIVCYQSTLFLGVTTVTVRYLSHKFILSII